MKALLITFVIALIVFSCSENQIGIKTPNPELKARGAEITAAVGKTLVSTVQKHMTEGGAEQAIEFCQLNALPITDSLSQLHDVVIKRTALKTRNSLNQPDSLERAFLNNYQVSGNFESQLISTENGTTYFEPIILKGFCQTCHGTPGVNMTLETDAIIKLNYPLDEATGFAEGDLRGMWALYFNE